MIMFDDFIIGPQCEGYLDDYTNDLQCEDFYDDRWADEDFCLDDYYEDGEWL